MEKLWNNIKEHCRLFLKKVFSWAMADELKELDDIRYMLGGKVAISADIHQNADSWAVISIKGKERSYIKFINLGRQDVITIARFLSQFEDRAVDASPNTVRILKEGYWL